MTPQKRKPAPTNGKQAVDIQVNLEALTWDDMRIIFTLWGKVLTTPQEMLEMAGLFDRIVVGGAKAVPLSKTTEVFTQLVTSLSDPKNSAPV